MCKKHKNQRLKQNKNLFDFIFFNLKFTDMIHSHGHNVVLSL